MKAFIILKYILSHRFVTKVYNISFKLINYILLLSEEQTFQNNNFCQKRYDYVSYST